MTFMCGENDICFDLMSICCIRNQIISPQFFVRTCVDYKDWKLKRSGTGLLKYRKNTTGLDNAWKSPRCNDPLLLKDGKTTGYYWRFLYRYFRPIVLLLIIAFMDPSFLARDPWRVVPLALTLLLKHAPMGHVQATRYAGGCWLLLNSS